MESSLPLLPSNSHAYTCKHSLCRPSSFSLLLHLAGNTKSRGWHQGKTGKTGVWGKKGKREHGLKGSFVLSFTSCGYTSCSVWQTRSSLPHTHTIILRLQNSTRLVVVSFPSLLIASVHNYGFIKDSWAETWEITLLRHCLWYQIMPSTVIIIIMYGCKCSTQGLVKVLKLNTLGRNWLRGAGVSFVERAASLLHIQFAPYKGLTSVFKVLWSLALFWQHKTCTWALRAWVAV